jgi:hypothetical protein
LCIDCCQKNIDAAQMVIDAKWYADEMIATQPACRQAGDDAMKK